MSVDRAAARIHEKLAARVEARARQGQRIAIDLHENAPRGGSNLNFFGQPRSAPGEPPAIEFGELITAMHLELNVDRAAATASFVVNRVGLEWGNRNVAPRPMGRMTSALLKQEVSGGG